MLKNILLTVSTITLLTACQPQEGQSWTSTILTPNNIMTAIDLSTKVHKDMTKEEVLSAIGLPTSTKQVAGSEYLLYNSDLLPNLDQDYFVELGSDQLVKKFGLVDNPYAQLPKEIYNAYK